MIERLSLLHGSSHPKTFLIGQDMMRFCVRDSNTPLTKRLHRNIRCAMQTSVVTGGMASTRHSIVQKLFLLEHAQKLVQLQCDSGVLGPRVLTKATANPFPDVFVHCACPLLHGPVPNLDVFL